MKIVQRHYLCGHDDHIDGMAAIPVIVMPWDKSVEPYPAIERCDECLSLGNGWTDEEARLALAENARCYFCHLTIRAGAAGTTDLEVLPEYHRTVHDDCLTRATVERRLFS